VVNIRPAVFGHSHHLIGAIQHDNLRKIPDMAPFYPLRIRPGYGTVLVPPLSQVDGYYKRLVTIGHCGGLSRGALEGNFARGGAETSRQENRQKDRRYQDAFLHIHSQLLVRSRWVNGAKAYLGKYKSPERNRDNFNTSGE
jgi:hypothetical protein